MSSKKSTQEFGNQIAQEMGANSAKELLDQAKEGLNSSSIAKQRTSKAVALDFTTKLIKLVLVQEIKSEFNLSKYQWVEYFNDEKIEAGDGKEYIKNLLTGIDSYNKNAFVPQEATPPSADAKVIRLYKDDGTLADYGFKALKPLTIMNNEWFQFFLSGKLMEFVDKQVDIMKKSLFFYKYNVISTVIKDLIEYSSNNNRTNIEISKKVTGNATNILSAFTNEIFPLIEDMQYFNNEYARDATKNSQYPNVNNREDILMLMNRNTLNKFKNGAMSNTLNARLINFNDVLPLENIIGVGKDLTIGTSKDNINVANTELIPENKVLLINKNLIKYLWYVDVVDNQQFAQNMSTQFIIHLWGVAGILDWEGAILYTNDNLTTLPITVRN